MDKIKTIITPVPLIIIYGIGVIVLLVVGILTATYYPTQEPYKTYFVSAVVEETDGTQWYTNTIITVKKNHAFSVTEVTEHIEKTYGYSNVVIISIEQGVKE